MLTDSQIHIIYIIYSYKIGVYVSKIGKKVYFCTD